MAERELSTRVRRRLSAALDGGAPLVAPLSSQARYATMRGPMPSARWRLRALTIAVAAVGIAVVALAGPQQPRDWVVQSVNGISKEVGIPTGSVTPSPRAEPTASAQRGPSGLGQPQATHKATAEPSESPEAEGTPASGPRQPQPSPTPEPGETGDNH